MAHFITLYTGDGARQFASDPPPLGAGMQDIAGQVGRIVVHGSGFNDPGGDWTEFAAYDQHGEHLRTVRHPGY
jgi:hypothetical protein